MAGPQAAPNIQQVGQDSQNGQMMLNAQQVQAAQMQTYEQSHQQMPNPAYQTPTTNWNAERFAQPNSRVGFQARTTETPVPENRTYRLKVLTSVEFEKKLLDTFSRQFVPVEARPNRDGDRTIGYYRLPTADGSYLDLALDRPKGIVTITGAPRTVDSTLQLLHLLDGPTEKDGRRTEIIPYSAVHYTALLQAIDVVEQETNGSEPEEPAGPNVAPNAPRFQNQGNLVQWQDGMGLNGESAVEGGTEGAPGGGIVGAVQIQVIDDINTVVLRGNKRDIEILMEMIKQLEAVSMEHKPEIVLFRMRHADAVRVTQIVLQLYNQVYSQRRGTVSLTAMKKPNAVLLVGQKESVEAAIELYKKLDLKVPPESQFLVIPLRNASSEYLATQLTTFYTENGTLSPLLRIVADTRVNALIIQGSPRDMSEVASLVRQLDAPTGKAVNQVKTIKLKNALASELATILQNAISGTTSTATTASTSTSSTRVGSRNAALEMLQVDPESGTSMRSGVLVDVRVTADSRSNSLIVSAPSETMPLVETLIMQLDQLPSAQSFIKLFTIVNGEAYSLAETLRELFGTTTGTTGATQSGSNQTFATTRAGTQAGDTTLVGIRFAVDVRTNSIIASGSASDLAIVEALLIRLDEENMHNREVITYRLKNSSATDVQSAVSSYLNEERSLENTATTYLVPQSPLEQYRKEVIIVAEPVTNTLIISTTPRHREAILRIIDELDDQPPMVCIQVLIAEVDLTNDCELGTQLGLQDAVLFNRSTAGVPGFDFITNPLGGNTETTDNSLIGTQGVTHLGLNQRGADGGPSGFVFSASGESLSILIRALEMSGKTQILSRPMMTTLDNKQAQLQVGEEFAAITDTVMENNNISNTVEWKPVGIVLDVTPRITSDNLVLMEIYVERSRTGQEKDGTVIAVQNNQQVRLPRIEKTMARSSLSAMSGQTVIMGGLIHEEKATTEIGVPLLNKIPILKHAFSYTTTSSERKELVIIMTPVVIRDEYDMEMLKQQEFGRMHWVMHDVIRVGGGKVRTRGCDWYADETRVVPMNKPKRPSENLMPSDEDILQKVPHPALSPAPTLKSE